MTEQSDHANALHWRFLFLQALRETGNVSAAARTAGKSRAAIYRARKQLPDFAADWADALEEAADWLELEALRRAVDGTEEGRYFRGEMIGTITRYSDSLLMFLLKARRPRPRPACGRVRHVVGPMILPGFYARRIPPERPSPPSAGLLAG